MQPSSFLLLGLLLSTLVPGSCLLPEVPDLYLDRLSIWSTNSSASNQIANGYDFGFTWRQGLPGVDSTALAFYNFKAGLNQIVSFRAQLMNTTTTGTIVKVSPAGENAGMIYLAFSVLVITSNSTSDLEVITLSRSNLTVGSNPSVYANSSKFNFSSWNTLPRRVASYQWVTGAGGVNASSSINYWGNMYLTTYYGSSSDPNDFRVSIWTGSSILLTAFKVNIIIVSRVFNLSGTASYFNTATAGGSSTGSGYTYFTYDLGVDTSLFHPPSSGQSCFKGIMTLDLYLPINNQSTEYYFNYNNGSISGISQNDLYTVRVNTMCLGLCAPGEYFNSGTCQSCNSSIAYCMSCISAYYCVECIPTLTFDSSLDQCVCPPRSFYNSFIPSCQPCSFDCFTCNSNNGSCATCNATYDHRQLNNMSRCSPLPGYYETNTSVAGQCFPDCQTCTSSSDCQGCFPYFYLGTGATPLCLACPYDCYTCDSSGNCLTCNDTADFRVLNGSRCVPMPGYFESFLRVASACEWGCQQCTSGTSCQLCFPNYIALNGDCECKPRTYYYYYYDRCQACHFTCYRCEYLSSSGYGCTTCNATSDHRYLSGSRCLPLPGYYESGASAALPCSQHCQLCKSASYCYQCLPGFIFDYGLYLNSSTLNCVACPYDCEACYPSGGCSLCNASDFRVLNRTSQRCQPIPGYYDAGVAVALRCEVGCLVCSSPTACSTCNSTFSLSGGLCYGPCPVRTYPNTSDTSNGTCQRCPYDCYTCNSGGSCLSCNSSLDFRQLSGTRCIPMAGYYESNQEVATQCPTGCASCTSASSCSICSSGFQLLGSLCLTACPTNNSFSTSNSPSTCQDLMPGLYLDKVALWSTNGSAHNQTAGGYTFPLTWRYALPSIFSSGLGLFNFKTGQHQTLSFQAELLNLTTSGAVVEMNPLSVDGGIVYLAFSVVVITGNSSHLELITVSSPVGSSRKTGLNFYANSSLFSFGGPDAPIAIRMYQWLGGVDYNTSSYHNYWANVRLTTYGPSAGKTYEMRIYFSMGGRVYFSGVKVNVLLVARAIGNSSTAVFSSWTSTGQYYYRRFSPNLGVPTPYFGMPSTGRSCIMGLTNIDLYVYHSKYYPKDTSFLFHYSSHNITEVTYSYIYGCSVRAFCLGQCPYGTFFGGSYCQPCNSSMPNCHSCSSAQVCLSCHGNLTLTNGSCLCQPHFFYNSFIPACEPCPFDCLTCSPNATCLSCNSSDFRVLSNSRCVPEPGYFQTNVSMAGQCLNECSVCTSGSDCSQCFVRYFLGSGPSCQACPYDCYTCDSNGTCLSCNSSTDHRFLNGTRCQPEVGYFSSNNLTVAQQCYPGCTRCLTASVCTACDSRHILNNNGGCDCSPGTYFSYSGCTRCYYKCLTCQGYSSFCTSCNASDNRVLVGARCEPLPGFYDNGQQAAVRCSGNCDNCHSTTYCYECAPRFIFNYIEYFNSSVLACVPCPYYCASCYAQGRCSSCNASDFRVFNSTSFYCQPLPGYFDNLLPVAAPCAVGCLNCTSLTSCSLCSSAFSLVNGLCYGTCPVRTYATSPNSANSTCNRCPFDCYQCDSSGNCLSCNSTTDFRELSGSRCIPMPGYYETNQPVAAKCPVGCTHCTSPSFCSSCATNFTLFNASCQTTCPTGNPLVSSFDPATCQDLMPNLYLDRIVIESTNGSYTAVAGGYSFPLNWRSPLPGTFASALGIETFKTAPHSTLSYTAELQNLTTTGAGLLFTPVSSIAGIMLITFSVIVIPQNTTAMELITLESGPINPSSYPILTANSTHFSFGGPTEPISTYFFQWVTGNNETSSYSINYWSWARLRKYPENSISNPHELKISFSSGYSIYMTGVKMVVLLVAPVINQYDTASYSVWTQDGMYFSKNFTKNLGVPTALYGQPSSGMSCITGLFTIDLYIYYSTNFNESTQFLFKYSGYEISDVTYRYIYGCSSMTLCLAQCAPRYFYNRNTNSCSICPYDCATCNNDQQCLSCSPNDFRELNASRCVPLPGYYESFSAVSLKCAPGCTDCTSATFCSSCSGGFHLQENVCVAGSSSSMMPIIIGVVIGLIVLGLIIGAILCYRRQGATITTGKDSDMTQDPKVQPVAVVESVDLKKSGSSAQSLASSEYLASDSAASWKEVLSEMSAPDLQCVECDGSSATVRSQCGHYYHIPCLRDMSKCPECQADLTTQTFVLCCNICRTKEINGSLWQLDQWSKTGGVMCEECRGDEKVQDL